MYIIYKYTDVCKCMIVCIYIQDTKLSKYTHRFNAFSTKINNIKHVMKYGVVTKIKCLKMKKTVGEFGFNNNTSCPTEKKKNKRY